MSKELTYWMSAGDRETGAHDAFVRTYRIIDPPDPLCVDKPCGMMHHCPHDGSGVGRAYALYMRNQQPTPTWKSTLLH